MHQNIHNEEIFAGLPRRITPSDVDGRFHSFGSPDRFLEYEFKNVEANLDEYFYSGQGLAQASFVAQRLHKVDRFVIVKHESDRCHYYKDDTRTEEPTPPTYSVQVEDVHSSHIAEWYVWAGGEVPSWENYLHKGDRWKSLYQYVDGFIQGEYL